MDDIFSDLDPDLSNSTPGQPAPAEVNTPTPTSDPSADMFSDLDPDQQPSNQTSGVSAFLRGAERSFLPAAGGLAAAGAGAEAGAAGGAAIGSIFGGVGAAPGALIGGMVGGIGGAFAGSGVVSNLQDWALHALPESWQDALGQSDRQQKLDQAYQPTASFLGGLVPYALTLKPSFNLAARALPDNATAWQKIVANPLTAHLFGGATMGGLELGQEIAGGKSPNWTNVAIATGFGVVFNKPNAWGEALTEVGAEPVRGVLGINGAEATPEVAPETQAPAPAPVPVPRETIPTVAQAGDAKVMGPGITEDVFMGSHQQAPEAAMTAQDTARTETSLIGPTPQGPDVTSIARRLEPETFARYDELTAQRNDLASHLDSIAQEQVEGAEAAPDAAAIQSHIAATNAELLDLTPQVQAAYRRAADVVGSETVAPETTPEPNGAPPPQEAVPATENPEQTAQPSAAGPVTASVQEQATAIASEVTRQLIAAGRPEVEAQADGLLAAHRVVARSAALGHTISPQELYQTDGAVIRRAGRLPLTPAERELAQRGTTLQQSTATSVDDVVSQAKQAGVDVSASETPQRITLSKIVVPKDQRSGGLGTQTMRDLVQYADATGKDIVLTPDNSFGGSVARLKKFYKEFGFTENKGKSKDFTTRETMIRAPQQSKELFQTASAPETPEFKNWFGDSKVVDAEGKPLVVYHGAYVDAEPRKSTGQKLGDFEIFDRFAAYTKGGRRGPDMDSVGSWFTDTPGDKGASAYAGSSGAVYPVYLSVEKPWRPTSFDQFLDTMHKAAGRDPKKQNPRGVGSTEELRSWLKDRGYDGIVFNKGAVDFPDQTVWVALDPTQIKSVANRGTFDPSDPRILFQPKRGSITFAEGRKPLIKLFKDADASTFIHESGHQWLEEMMRDAVHPAATDALKTDAQTVRDWLGMDNDQIQTRQHEKFARGFEQYMREGIAPSAGLARVFSQFKTWLTQIYQTIKGLGSPINENIRGVFDRMLAEEPQRTVLAPERETEQSLAALHETEAAEALPHEAGPIGDRIAAERDAYIAQQPVEVQNELARATATAGTDNGPEGGAGAGGGPEVVAGGVEPEPQLEGGAGGGERSPLIAGSGTGVPQGAGVPAGPVSGTDAGLRNERSGATVASRPQPLAPEPANLFGARESPFVDKAGNIRIDNLTTNQDVAQAIRDSAQENNDFIGDRRGVITDGQVLDLADALGMTPDNLNKRQLGQAFNAEQVVAARKLLIQSATDVAALMKRVADGGTDEDVLAYAQAKARHQMIQGQVAGITAEAGRALRAFRDISGSAQAKGVDQFIREATGKTLFQLREEAKLGSQLDSAEQVSKFVRDGQKRTFGSMVLEYWINGLISGPATHTTYAIGNTILSLERMGPETAAAAAIGAIRRAMGREGPTVKLGEVGAQFRAAGAALPSAAKAAIEALRTGVTTRLPGEEPKSLPFQPGTEFAPSSVIDESMRYSDVAPYAFGLVQGIRDGLVSTGKLVSAGGVSGEPLIGLRYSPLGAIPDVTVRGINTLPVGTVLRVPSRFVAAIHSFFRTANYSMAKNALAYRSAAEAGLEGTAFDAHVANLRQNPTTDMMEAARGQSNQLTLMGKGSEFVQALSKLTNAKILGFPILKFVDPFVHIAGNVLDQSIVQRTPLGILAPEIRADLMGKNGTVAQDTAMAKMLVGTGIALGFGSLAAQGLLSGSEPSDPNQAAMWRLAGNQAHSIRIGDIWYDVHRLGPMGMLASMSADMYDVAHAASEGDMSVAGGALLHAFTQTILDESFMSGPSELIQALEDPGRYGASYVRNQIGTFIPYSVAMSQMDRATDPYSRQAKTIIDAIRNKVPGMSESLMPRRDIWGQPIANLPAVGGRAVSAIYAQQISTDPVNQAMLSLGIYPAQVDRKIRGVALTDAQYDQFATLAGRMTKQRLDMIVSSPDWRTWDPTTQHSVIEETIRQSREAARGMMLARFPQIAVDATRAKLAPLNVGGN